MIGKIYKIVHSQSKICYVGSTFNTIVKRFQHHKNITSKCCIAKYFKLYGIDQFKIILIKEYEVCDRKHLFAYEQLWISKLSTIEQFNTLFIKKQYHNHYRAAHQDIIRERINQYRAANKDKISEKGKQKYVCECGSEITCSGKTQHERSIRHLDHLAGKINIPKGPKYKCECGSESTIHHKARHERTKKHKDWVSTQA